MLRRTPVLILLVLCTAHTLMAITSLFSNTHMVWTLLVEITLPLCSPYSSATTMVYWHDRSLKRFIFQSAINFYSQKKWTITFAPSEKTSFWRRPNREPCPTLTNFSFFPHSKMFSKSENFLLNNTLYLELKFFDLPDPEGPTPSTSRPWCFS